MCSPGTASCLPPGKTCPETQYSCAAWHQYKLDNTFSHRELAILLTYHERHAVVGKRFGLAGYLAQRFTVHWHQHAELIDARFTRIPAA